jgi:hypothetical protein
VTIAQAAAPVIYTTIPALFAAATSTSSPVTVTFGNWVVTGVNGNQLFVTDGTNGFIVYQKDHDFVVGNTLSGTVDCNLVLYNGSAEITGLTTSTTGLTVGTDGVVTPVVTTIDALEAVNTGSVVTLQKLTYDGSAFTDGTNTIIPQTSLYAGTFEEGKTYNVTGVFLLNNTSKRILPRSADDIEEIVVPEISADDVNIAYDATAGSIVFTIENGVEGGTVSAALTSGDWLTLGNETTSPISFTCSANDGAARTATVTLTYTYNTNETVTKNVTVTQAKVSGIVDGMFDFSEDEDYGSGLSKSGVKEQTSTWTAGNVTMVMTGRNCWFYVENGDNNIRLYKASNGAAAGSITLSVPTGYFITSIDFTGASLNKMSPAEGTYTKTNENKSANWTGCANSITFTASDRTDIVTIKVTYVQAPATLTKTVTSAGYATYCGEFPLDFTESGLTAYIATVSGTQVSFTPVTTVPANTGVLLKGEAGEHTINVVAVSETNVDANVLKGVLTDTEVPAGIFVLMNPVGGQGVGFYRTNNAFTIRAKTAYLPAELAPSRSFIGFDDITAVKSIIADAEATGEVYNLQGQRVKNAQKGLYIMNGKKVLVK